MAQSETLKLYIIDTIYDTRQYADTFEKTPRKCLLHTIFQKL